MKKENNPRRQREIALNDSDGSPLGSSGDVKSLMLELGVRQEELKSQNEELRLVQLELSRARDRYQELFDSAPIGYLILDRSCMIREANLKAKSLLGIAGKDLIGNPLSKFMEQGEADAYDLHLLEVRKRGNQQSCERVFRRPNGSSFHGHLETSPYEDSLFGNGWRIALDDITYRKKAEEALRKSEEKFAKTFRSNPACVGLSRLKDGCVIEANEALLRLLGYSENEFIGHSIVELGVWHDLKDRERVVKTLKAEGRSRNQEYWLQTRNGELLLCNHSAELIQIDNEPHIIFTFFDITEHKHMEQELKQSEERFRMTVESAPDAIFVRSASGHFVYLNHAAVSLFGAASAGQLIGRQVMERIPPAEHASFAERIKLINEGHAVPMIERTYLRIDGSPVDVEVSAVPFEYEGTNGALVFARDVTERKRAEQALRASERSLRQLQRMEAMGTLAGGIAHDFNNILAVMIGFTEMAMLETEDLPDVQSNLEQVHKAGLRAQDLVRQILTFSRHTDQELKPVVVSHLIKEAVKMLRATIPSSIQIRHDIRPRTSAVLADPTQIHQVLMNLVTNASHAVQEIRAGSIEITLNDETLDKKSAAIHPDLKPGRYVVLKVRDNGAGIPPGIIERIFDPFFTTKETGKGTGMGLAVVHGIAKSHGGAITVQSELGAGSTFTVYFPALEKAAARPEDQLEPVARGTGRILFVDDEETLASMGQIMLRKLGYEVDIMTSSLDALDAFRAHPQKYDLVITDYTMPGMTGMALSEELLKIRPDIPIILCTGYSEVTTPEKVKTAGIRELLMKPVTRAQIAQAVKQVLTPHSA
ncbi:MAG TPA: PAS domain S-box protein [Syntrophales bacterium]|nr:PAS domain S-box protein [Syntrophales bacterium]